MIHKKHLLPLSFLFCVHLAAAQNPVFIPPTLSGTTFNLEIKDSTHLFFNGFTTQTIAYNGGYLGPTLIVNAGDSITLNVHNAIADTTTTHWHGLHVSPANDGGPHTMIMSGDTWSPSFRVRDKAATYWYHPHLHHKTMSHVLKGAAGVIIVRDAEESALALPRTYGSDDVPLVLQYQTFDPMTKQIIVQDTSDTNVIVNGTIEPFINSPAQVVRYRLLNASSFRVFRLGLSNGQNMIQIASDGGLLDAPVSLTRLDLSPGERAEILLNLTSMEGDSIFLQSFNSELSSGTPGGLDMMGGPVSVYDGVDFNVLNIKVTAQTANPITTIPATLTTNTIWSSTGAPSRDFSFSSVPMGSNNFFINGQQFMHDEINFTTTRNATEVWNVINNTVVAHPFHVHGNHFYVLNVNASAPPANLRGRKDVILVPPMQSVRIITKFETFADPDHPYMYHCHILSHEDHGMMGQFIVNPEGTAVETHHHHHNTTQGIVFRPNPVLKGGILYIDSDKVIEKLTIINTSGMVCYESAEPFYFKNLILDLPQGFYFIKTLTEAGEEVEKLIILEK